MNSGKSFIELEKMLIDYILKAPIDKWNFENLTEDFLINLNVSTERIRNKSMINDFKSKIYNQGDKENSDALNRIARIYHSKWYFNEEFNLAMVNIGTIIMKSFWQDYGTIHDVFSLAGQNVSLPDVVSMYNSKNFRGISLLTPAIFKERVDNDCNVYSIFSDCEEMKYTRTSDFEECFNFIQNVSESQMDYKYWESHHERKHTHILPCKNLTMYPNCSKYCQWHKDLFTKTPKGEFLTIMKYAQLQRKVITYLNDTKDLDLISNE